MSEPIILTSTMLKEMLPDAVVNRATTVKDLDDMILFSGVYRTRPEETTNLPPGAYRYGILIVERADFNGQIFLIQRYYADNGEIYVRHYWNTSWRDWKKMVTETVTA